MFNRPSARRKSGSRGINLNLVPILDTMITLISFMLFTMSFIALVSIESPFPQISDADIDERLKEKPLQLTVSIRENETEVWSPFERIAPKTIPNIGPGQPDLKAVHEAVLNVKQTFPQERKVVIVPAAAVTYDILVDTMDALRTIDPTDPPIFARNMATGNDETVKTLFPDVIFGNLLGDG